MELCKSNFMLLLIIWKLGVCCSMAIGCTMRAGLPFCTWISGFDCRCEADLQLWVEFLKFDCNEIDNMQLFC